MIIKLNEKYSLVEASNSGIDGYEKVGEINFIGNIRIFKTPILGVHLGIENLLKQNEHLLNKDKKYLLLVNLNKEDMELTAVDFLIHNIVKDQNVKAKSMKEWLNIFEQAKEMDKKQKSDEYWKGWKAYGESL